MIFRNTFAAATALFALSTITACKPVCESVPATVERINGENPFGIAAPQIENPDPYNREFDIVVGDQRFTVATRSLWPGEEGYNPAGGNAVMRGFVAGDDIVATDDLLSLGTAIGVTAHQAGFLADTVAQDYLDYLNAGNSDAAVGRSFFKRWPAMPHDDFERGDALIEFGNMNDTFNVALRDNYQGTQATPGSQCPAAQGMTSRGFGDVYEPAVAEPREPAKPIDWSKGIPWLLLLVGTAGAAFVANRLLKGNTFETLYADPTEDQEVVVLRDTRLKENDVNAFVVFERKYTPSPAESATKNDGDGYEGSVKRQGKYWVQQARTAKQYTEMTAALKAEKDDWVITTGNKDLWDKIRPNVEARNEAEGERTLVDQHLREHIRKVTIRPNVEARNEAEGERTLVDQHLREHIRKVTKGYGPRDKRGKIVGNLLPRIVFKKRMAEGLDTLASHTSDNAETEALLEIAQTLRDGRPQVLNTRPASLIRQQL